MKSGTGSRAAGERHRPVLETGRRAPQIARALADVPGASFRSTMDPSTAQPYPYRAMDASRYELCASFEARGRGRGLRRSLLVPRRRAANVSSWTRRSGRAVSYADPEVEGSAWTKGRHNGVYSDRRRTSRRQTTEERLPTCSASVMRCTARVRSRCPSCLHRSVAASTGSSIAASCGSRPGTAITSTRTRCRSGTPGSWAVAFSFLVIAAGVAAAGR